MLVQMSGTYEHQAYSLIPARAAGLGSEVRRHLDCRWFECDKLAYPLRIWQTPLLRIHSCTILTAPFGLSNEHLHLRIVLQPARHPPSVSPGLVCCPSKMILHRRPRPTRLERLKRSWNSTTL